MHFRFIMSGYSDNTVEDGSSVTENSLKVAREYMEKGYFKDIWIQGKDGTRFYLSLTPIPNVTYDTMADHE